MRKQWVVVLGVALLIGCSKLQQPVAEVQFFTPEPITIQVYVADAPEERTAGLANVKALLENEGMIFIFEEADHYQFWMKDVGYPIDIIWLYNNTIVDTTSHIEPEAKETAESAYQRYQPKVPINQVIEVQAGFIDKYQVKEGQIVDIKGLDAS